MKAIILDQDTFDRRDIDLTPLTLLPMDWQFHRSTNHHQISERIGDCEIVITNKIVVDRTTLDVCDHVKLILIAATGTDNVDLDACAEKGITVCNVRHYATPAVAQHTIALMLNLATNQLQFTKDVKNGKWQMSPVFCLLDHPIVELENKVLGIVGYGTLGSRVATIAESMGMRIRICQRPGGKVQPDRIAFDEILSGSDIITLHCPLTPETHHLFGPREFENMKESAFLINTARGAIVDYEALVNALEHGQIAGAGIDVLEQEPPLTGHPLLKSAHPNLIVTPHNAWGTRESRQRLVNQMGINLSSWLNGSPVNVVLA